VKRRTGEDDVGVRGAGVIQTRGEGREGETDGVKGGGCEGMRVC